MNIGFLTHGYLKKFFDVELSETQGIIKYQERYGNIGKGVAEIVNSYIREKTCRHKFVKHDYTDVIILNLPRFAVAHRKRMLVFQDVPPLNRHGKAFDETILKRPPKSGSKVQYFKYDIVSTVNQYLRDEFYTVFFGFVTEKLLHIGNDEGKFNYGDKKFVISQFLEKYSLLEDDIPYATLYRELTEHEKSEKYAQRVQSIIAFKQEFWKFRQNKIRPVNSASKSAGIQRRIFA